jgi:hypothetical protein
MRAIVAILIGMLGTAKGYAVESVIVEESGTACQVIENTSTRSETVTVLGLR